MDSLDSRLIQLNQALLKLYSNGKAPVDKDMLDNAIQVLSGATIDTGPGNDTIIINQRDDCNCPPGPPGPQGEPGPPGPPGPQGEQGIPGTPCTCLYNTVLVDDDYYANGENFYIGVNSESPVTIYLPDYVQDGFMLIIKSEMEPPMGNRKITIKSESNQLIDGDEDYIMTVSYESVTVLYRGNEWHIIN